MATAATKAPKTMSYRLPVAVGILFLILIVGAAPGYLLVVTMTKNSSSSSETVRSNRISPNATSLARHEIQNVAEDPNPEEPVPKVAWLMTFPNSVRMEGNSR